MILPDLNLAIYAYNEDAPEHSRASAYWRERLDDEEPFVLTSVVMGGFVRVVTNPRALARPYLIPVALDIVAEGTARPNVVQIEPGPAHLSLFIDLMRRADAASRGSVHRLVTDAHLAALAIECGARLHSHDRDFARWTELDWRDPLV